MTPQPSTIVPTTPTARITYQGYQYWCEGFAVPGNHDKGYRYLIQKIGSTDDPETCQEPFPLVTQAGFAARTAIDTWLAVLEPTPEAPPEKSEPDAEVIDPAPKRKASRKPKSEPEAAAPQTRSRKKPQSDAEAATEF